MYCAYALGILLVFRLYLIALYVTYVIVRESQFELVVFGILYYAYVLNCIFVDVSMSKKCCLKVSKKHFFR